MPRDDRHLPKALQGLRIPLIASPLFIISVPKLVIAQCKAGIVGSFPALNARVETILSGRIPGPSRHHAVYAALEVAKALGLLALAFSGRVTDRHRMQTGPDHEWQSDAM